MCLCLCACTCACACVWVFSFRLYIKYLWSDRMTDWLTYCCNIIYNDNTYVIHYYIFNFFIISLRTNEWNSELQYQHNDKLFVVLFYYTSFVLVLKETSRDTFYFIWFILFWKTSLSFDFSFAMHAFCKKGNDCLSNGTSWFVRSFVRLFYHTVG